MLGTILAVASSGAPAPSDAQPPGPSIEWSGPENCTEAAFSAEFSRYFDAETPAPPGTIRARVTQTESGLQLQLKVEHAGVASERTFEDPRCEAVIKAGAFVAAIVLDPDAMERGRSDVAPPEPDPEPEPPPVEPKPEPEPPPEPQPPAPPPRPWAWIALAGGVGGIALPAVGGVVRADGGIRGRRWKVGLTGVYRSPRSANADLFPRASARLSYWAVGLRGCYEPATGRWAFPLCGGAEAGLVHAVGRGLSTSTNAQLPWVALVPGAGVRVSLTDRWSVVARFEPAFVVLYQQFVVESGGEVWRLQPVSARGVLGVEVAFGPRPRTDAT